MDGITMIQVLWWAYGLPMLFCVLIGPIIMASIRSMAYDHKPVIEEEDVQKWQKIAVVPGLNIFIMLGVSGALLIVLPVWTINLFLKD